MSTSNSFEIPYALDSRKTLVSSISAVKEESYLCPGCLDRVIFRKGEINKPHFAHRASHSCSKEAVLERIRQHVTMDQLESVLKDTHRTSEEDPTIGEWTTGSFTLLAKPRTCPAGHRSAVYTWPDGSTQGHVPNTDFLPTSIQKIGDGPLWASSCKVCNCLFAL